MKGIFVTISGLGDSPNRQLNGKTVLEASDIPNLNFLATRGELGVCFPISAGFVPAPEDFILNVFGNKFKSCSEGKLEAVGAGVHLEKGDLVFRINIGSIDSIEAGNILDRRAGRTLNFKEAKSLSKIINSIQFPYKFEFVLTGQHRGILVFRGNFTEKISGTDITYSNNSEKFPKIIKSIPREKSVLARETAEMVNDFLSLVYNELKNCKVNLKRKKAGLLPANYLFLRGQSSSSVKINRCRGWFSANYTPLEIGFSKLSGIENFSFKYPKMRGVDSYKNMWDGLKKAIKNAIGTIKKNADDYDYFWVHFDELDACSLDNKPIEKKMMLEYLDKEFFRYIAMIAPMNNIKVVVTGDHVTLCNSKSYSGNAVPLLFYNGNIVKERVCFNEEEAKKGSLGRILGADLFKKTFGK